jgi:hypothetical protein
MRAHVDAMRYNLAHEFARVLTPFLVSVEGLQQSGRKQQRDTALADIQADLAEVRSVAETLPQAMSAPLLNVLDTGSPDEVREIVAALRQTGKGASAASAPGASRPQPPKKSAPRAAVAATSRPRTGASERATPVDQNDFDSAFNEAVGE